MGKKQMFSDELREVLRSKKPNIEVGSKKELQRLVDGEPVNIDPIKEEPKVKMRLYGLIYKSGINIYFDTEKELIDYIKEYGCLESLPTILEYLGNYLGRNDVIRKTIIDSKSKFYTRIDNNNYAIYNHKRSFYKGEHVWEYNHGNINDLYNEFIKRGITIKENNINNVKVIKKINETYEEIDRRALNLGLNLFIETNQKHNEKVLSLKR